MSSTVYPVQVAQNHSTIAVLTRPFKQHPVVVAELELVSAEVDKQFLSVNEDNEQRKTSTTADSCSTNTYCL